MTTIGLTKTLQQQAVAQCCKHRGAATPEAATACNEGHTSTFACASAPACASQSSRRTRLWELPIELHRSIIGVCFSIEALRRLVVKHYKSPCIVGDYEVHSVVVQACSSRTPLIELLQRELDRSFQKQIKHFLVAKSGDAVAQLWRGAISGEDETTSLAGALWASLTHPRADKAVMTQIGHDIHMIQHRVGTDARRDTQALTQAKLLNVQRLAELEAARAKLSAVQKEHEQLAKVRRQQVLDAETALVGAKAHQETLKSQLESLRRSVVALDSREKLTQRVSDLTDQNAKLKQQLGEALANQGRKDPALQLTLDDAASVAPQDLIKPMPRTVNLSSISVLCVGGRSSAVVSYRQAVERAGGKFIHHDGGIEHNHHRLDANLASADCVVCQTACISHSAYWLVKDYCKKTGKRCVYLEKPSMSSFVEGLSTLPNESTLAPSETLAMINPLTRSTAPIHT